MDYRPAPSSGGGALPIYYNEVNLTTSDLQQLNTTPFDIVPAVADNYIIPIWFQIFARVDSANAGLNVYFGNFNALSLNVYYYYNLLNLSTIVPGEIDLILPMQQANPAISQPTFNTKANKSVVLYMQADDNTFIASTFTVRTAYYLTPIF